MRTSFWFVPGSLVVLSAVIAHAIIAFDRSDASDSFTQWLQPEAVSADGVRSLLSTAATAVLTLAGLTFSATLVALTLASSQFGSRILRNFIRSLPNQFALGMLLGNFVFCLIVLRAVRSAEEGEFIPHIATLGAFLATLTSLATFIHFVHHISVSLQADRIISSIHSELDQAIERFFPDCRPEDPDERKADQEKSEWETIENEIPINANRSGYIAAINVEGLVETCAELGVRCRVLLRPGQFVQEGSTLLAVSHDGDLEDAELQRLRRDVLLDRIRTAEQDFEFCLRQLVEVALRALSPGINDPFTAMNCIDYLGDALGKVATRKLPKRTFSDAEKVPRVRVRPTVFADLLGAAFHQIRQAAADRADIAIRLLDVLEEIGDRAMLDTHRDAIAEHADAVLACASSVDGCDREPVEAAHRRVMEALGRS
ncbi:hypothetical protein HAHE_24230 [Haloferula helveola]|uniref:DUF2254 domain-containing protein n=1 Tax=Haloferula helveola TaxID=490095 RepID=A0ABM7RGQ2_9BACT|nr:hypothetical protein HAHE_24230 [Haloferula helveola]